MAIKCRVAYDCLCLLYFLYHILYHILFCSLISQLLVVWLFSSSFLTNIVKSCISLSNIFNSFPDSIKISPSLSSFRSVASRFIASLTVFKRVRCNWMLRGYARARARACVCVCVCVCVGGAFMCVYMCMCASVWFQLLIYLLLQCCFILILLLVGFVTAILLTPNHLQMLLLSIIFMFMLMLLYVYVL